MDRNPSQAHRYTPNAAVTAAAARIGEVGSENTAVPLSALEDAPLESVAVEEVRVGDVLLVRPNEVVPVDSVLLSAPAEFNTSSLTGESLPVEHSTGDEVLSGETNGVQATLVRVIRPHDQSAFQRVIQLVRDAENAKAPIERLADRWALPFTVISLVIAGAAWAISGDPLRFAQVLVLATPCPLLLAAPVAFLGGLSASSRQGVVVKGGGVLEQLAEVKSLAVDKTGTLTRGKPTLADIRPVAGVTADEMLRVAGSAEQYSTHAFARSIVEAAQAKFPLSTAVDAQEIATNGVRATVNGRVVIIGKPAFAAAAAHLDEQQIRTPLQPGQTAAYLTVDGEYWGAFVLADNIRPEAQETLRRLRSLGLGHTTMLTGDTSETAHHVADQLGIESVAAELLPEDKVDAVRAMQQRPVLMVGDGINDAPVLAAAEVGIALGASGATAAGEAADAVVLRDAIDAIPNVIETAKRTVRIAKQAIGIGMALSIGLMLIASTGVIPVVAGALTQEFVDLAAIGWAMLALRTPGKR